ncbi:hypothetical protein [Aminivibrio sp.]|jgi:hypothetical protein|uniref:hypothetical protein n=1 Tax=Aminivibrio sp. TaxID=1872489 RepID=UPI003D950F16
MERTGETGNIKTAGRTPAVFISLHEKEKKNHFPFQGEQPVLFPVVQSFRVLPKPPG